MPAGSSCRSRSIPLDCKIIATAGLLTRSRRDAFPAGLGPVAKDCQDLLCHFGWQELTAEGTVADFTAFPFNRSGGCGTPLRTIAQQKYKKFGFARPYNEKRSPYGDLSEPKPGLEPGTSSLRVKRSTKLSYFGLPRH